MDSKGEVLLTIMASLAQQESQSLSQNVKNNGIVPQYYVEGNHEAIIPKDIFLRVQEELVRRRVVKTSANGKKHSYSCNRTSLRSSGMPRKPPLTVLMNNFWSSRRSFLKRLTTRKPTMRLPTKFSSSANSAGSVLLTLLPEMHRLPESTTCRISSRSSVPTLLNSMKPWLNAG